MGQEHVCWPPCWHGESASVTGLSRSNHILGTHVPVEEPSTASLPDMENSLRSAQTSVV
jgi:hypothetical protein